MEIPAALDLIRAAVAAERSGGFLVVGDLAGACAAFAEGALAILFPDAAEQLAAGTHPDVFRLEPQGKSRSIMVDDIREKIVAPLAQTSFAGGWKVGLVSGADRMNAAAANAFLKSLEEPTPRTLYLLMTDQPDVVMPTIVSRCQRIDLALSDGLLADEDRARVLRVLEPGPGNALFAKAAAGRALAALLAEFKDAAEDADIPQVRKAFFRTVLSVARRWMVEGRLPRYLAIRNIESVEDAFRQSERYLPDEMVLSFLTDRMTFPE